MEISITPRRLIDLAKDVSGMEQQAMAEELSISKQRISQIKTGHCALTPTEGYYFCMKAGLPFEKTMAELEAVRDPKNAAIWTLAASARKS